MYKERTLKGTPVQFFNMVDRFNLENMERSLTGPIYAIQPGKDADQVEVRFRNSYVEHRDPWGTILVTSTVDPQFSLLTMVTDNEWWNDVKEAWEALEEEMIKRKLIEPDSASATEEEEPIWMQIPDRSDDREMLRMWWEGKKAAAIAKALSLRRAEDVTEKTVHNRLSVLQTHYSRQVPTDEERRELGIVGK